MTHNRNKATTYWTLAITSIALFMVSLDNLVVTTALPVIRRELHASISQLEWTVNAYTLTFAVLLLTGAALGDRFGRRRMFVLGLLLFTGASAVAALSTSANALDIARALQGVGGAIVTPLTLTILSAAVPAERRGLALGIWGGIGGLADRARPARRRRDRQRRLVELDLLAERADRARARPARLPAARGDEGRRVERSTCRGSGSRAPGCSASCGASCAATRPAGRASRSSAPIVVGALLVAAFVAWELRTPSPMLPMEFFRNRTFALTNVASLFMFFGMFGSIFFLAQFFQTVQGYSPLQSGLRILPWTAMPIFIAPLAGALSDRIGGQRLDGGRPRAPGGRPALDRGRQHADDAVHRPRRAVRALRHRHVALLRAGRERRAELGAAGARGQGVRREQRDPRARRRLRRRGAGRGVLARRRLPVRRSRSRTA